MECSDALRAWGGTSALGLVSLCSLYLWVWACVQLAEALDYNDDFLQQAAAGGDVANSGELGGKTDRYEWIQTENDVEMRIQLPEGTGKDGIKCKITSKGLDLQIQGREAIKGEWFDAVIPDESAWQFGESIFSYE